MKKFIMLAAIIAPLVLSAEGRPKFTPTEKYQGKANGVKVVFETMNYTSYRLTGGTKITEGECNTERGFGSDDNATVYVLDSDKPEGAQRFIVRLSSGKVVMLDANRKIVKGSKLVKVKLPKGK